MSNQEFNQKIDSLLQNSQKQITQMSDEEKKVKTRTSKRFAKKVDNQPLGITDFQVEVSIKS